VHTQGGEAVVMVEEAPTEAAVKGGALPAATQGAPAAGGPKGALPIVLLLPLPFLVL
jgi:hypothetical protein